MNTIAGLTDMREYVQNLPIDIFTDTSTIKVNTEKGEVPVVCSGFTAVVGFVPTQSPLAVYINESTIAGEAKALENAISWVKWFLARRLVRPVVRFFSDSLSSIQKICAVFEYYTKKSRSRSDNPDSPVDIRADLRNKFDIYTIEVFLSLFSSGLEIYFYYVPGHMPIHDIRSLKSRVGKYIEKFSYHNSNLILAGGYKDLMNESAMIYFATYNNAIDIMTRNYLYQYGGYIENDIRYLVAKGYLLGDRKVNSAIMWPVNMNSFIDEQMPGQITMVQGFDATPFLPPQS